MLVDNGDGTFSIKPPYSFEKQEPVAWIDYLEDSNLYDLNVSGRGVPLYTAPRELSDEEIKAIANNLTCTPDKNWNVLFAKAILKKASEK